MIIDMTTPLDCKDASSTLSTPIDVSDPNRPKIFIRPRSKDYAKRRREAALCSPLTPNLLPTSARFNTKSPTSLIDKDVNDSDREGAKKAKHSAVFSGDIRKSMRWHSMATSLPPSSPRSMMPSASKHSQPRSLLGSSSRPEPYTCAQCMKHSKLQSHCDFCQLIHLMDKFCETVNRFEVAYAQRSVTSS